MDQNLIKIMISEVTTDLKENGFFGGLYQGWKYDAHRPQDWFRIKKEMGSITHYILDFSQIFYTNEPLKNDKKKGSLHWSKLIL